MHINYFMPKEDIGLIRLIIKKKKTFSVPSYKSLHFLECGDSLKVYSVPNF